MSFSKSLTNQCTNINALKPHLSVSGTTSFTAAELMQAIEDLEEVAPNSMTSDLQSDELTDSGIETDSPSKYIIIIDLFFKHLPSDLTTSFRRTHHFYDNLFKTTILFIRPTEWRLHQ
mgnify:CR=1 FL=1